jgi:hypothetical protein
MPDADEAAGRRYRRAALAAAIAALACSAGSASATSVVAQPGEDITIAGASCSAGFVVRDIRTHLSYLTTAGHCVNSALRPQWTTPSGDRLWSQRFGPAVTDDAGATVGHVVYTTLSATSDFTVIALNRGVIVNAAVPAWGQVKGVDASPTPGETVKIYGQGEAVSAVDPAREGVVTSVQADVVRTAIGSLPGDSGCPVINSSNAAIGLLIALQPSGPPATGMINVIRLPVMLQRANAAMHARLVVV